MRLLILRSRARPSGEAGGCGQADGGRSDYTQEFSSAFAQRVVRNLKGEPDACTACGGDCTGCRKAYDRRFGGDIVGIVELPHVLPYLLEDPARHVPPDVPPHDVLLAVHVHEQILLEFLKRCATWGTRALVAPVEAPNWVRGAARAQAKALADDLGVEVGFPKPFCDFDPPNGTVLAEFRRQYHIGKPQVDLTVRDGRIERAHVEVSAACGATYYVARWLTGRRIDEDLKYEIVAKRLHSYPCTASMEWDDELGDTILHVSGQAHYEILAPLGGGGREEPGMVLSPVGRMVQRPVPAREGVRNIERAKEAIMEELIAGREVSVAGLRRRRKIPTAAAYSALILLEQEGKVRREADRIVLA